MYTPIPDGEIHPCSKDYAYILKFIENSDEKSIKNVLSELQIEFVKKYAEYLYSIDKEKVIKILMEFFLLDFVEDIQFVYKPASQTCMLNQVGSFALKFKRSEDDKL